MCTHLGADRIWTCQTTHYNGYMFENPKTPYSIYIRMIIYIHSNFPTAPPFPVVTLPGASCKAWGLGRPKPEGRKTMGFCHGMFHRIVMDLYNRFCWCDFFGTSRDFMGYHGIYIYIYIHFVWYAWGYFGGYSWKNMCLKHHQLGIEWDLMDVCRLVICYMAMA